MKKTNYVTRSCPKCKSNIGNTWQGSSCPGCGCSLDEWGVNVDFVIKLGK